MKPLNRDMVYTMSFATDSNAPLTGTQVMPMVFYCFAMFVVMMVSIFFKIGTKDFMDKLSPEMRAEYDHEDYVTGKKAAQKEA